MEKIEIIELVKYRNSLLHSLRQELRQLELAEQDLLHTPCREIRLQRMKDLKAMIKEIDLTFTETGTFNTDEFTDFLAKFFTLTGEGEKVKARIRTGLEYAYPDGHRERINCYVVADPDTLELLRKNIKTDDDIMSYMRSKPTEGVTKIAGNYVYPFKDNARMKNKYGKHYRLKYAIYELMQLRIDHPEMTDQERYQQVLQNTIERNARKAK